MPDVKSNQPTNNSEGSSSGPYLMPGGESFYLPGGETGCLLLHGFTSMPEEMLPLGEYLAGKGFTVMGVRFTGHGTHPDDLLLTHWADWLVDVEDGLGMLAKR